MRAAKRYHEVFRGGNQEPIRVKARAGCKHKRDAASELHFILRNATYQLIGIGNALRRASADFSSLDGSNWRNNRNVDAEVQAVAAKLYRMDPSDWNAVLELERELEAILEKCATKNGGAQ